MWLILIDAYSKWPEIYAMSATTAQATIHQLRKIFAVLASQSYLSLITVRNLLQVSLRVFANLEKFTIL